MAIVTFGDSITDGATSTHDANASWPSVLARRLQAAGMKNVAVLNEGFRWQSRGRATGRGRMRSLGSIAMCSAQPGVKYLVIMEGINDIGQGTRDGAPADAAITADELIAAYRQIGGSGA